MSRFFHLLFPKGIVYRAPSGRNETSILKLPWDEEAYGSSCAFGDPRALRPDVLFMSEAHLSKAKAEHLKRRLGFKVMAVLESDCRSGGLVMFWYTKLDATSFEVHPNYLYSDKQR